MWKPCQFDFGGLICLGSSWALGHVFIYIHNSIPYKVCMPIYILYVCVELRMIMYVHVYAYYYILL